MSGNNWEKMVLQVTWSQAMKSFKGNKLQLENTGNQCSSHSSGVMCVKYLTPFTTHAPTLQLSGLEASKCLSRASLYRVHCDKLIQMRGHNAMSHWQTQWHEVFFLILLLSWLSELSQAKCSASKLVYHYVMGFHLGRVTHKILQFSTKTGNVLIIGII